MYAIHSAFRRAVRHVPLSDLQKSKSRVSATETRGCSSSSSSFSSFSTSSSVSSSSLCSPALSSVSNLSYLSSLSSSSSSLSSSSLLSSTVQCPLCKTEVERNEKAIRKHRKSLECGVSSIDSFVTSSKNISSSINKNKSKSKNKNKSKNENDNDKNKNKNQNKNSERLIMCTLCLDLFTSRSQLYTHRKLVHNLSASSVSSLSNRKNDNDNDNRNRNGNGKFKCNFDGCGKEFDQLRQYTRHKKTHLNFYQCNICFQSYSSRAYLKIHSRIHFNNKCEICQYCNKKFSDPSSRRKHIKYYHLDGIKKKQEFHCHLCKKILKTKDGLKIHIMTHSNGKDRVKYKCDKCPHETFSTKSNLMRHKRKFH